MRKLLITTALIAALTIPNQAKAFDPITAIVIAIATYKSSQAINHISGGEDTLTLTEQSYQNCNKGNDAACAEKGIYTAAFFPVDTVLAVVTGNADKVGGSHGALWHELDKSIPTISKVQRSYGGAHYNQFIQKRR